MDILRLVEQCKSGEKEAFGQLYQTYLPTMRKIVAYYIHDSDAAWDILHDGFLIAFTSIGSLNNNARVETWLATIMKNLSLQYLKGESYLLTVPMHDIDLPDNEISDSDSVECLAWDDLDKIINELPEGYGSVFRLAVLDGLSHKEISGLLGIAPHSSSSQLSHAKAMLRRLIIDYRTAMGVFLLIAIIAYFRYEIFKYRMESFPTPEICTGACMSVATGVDSVSMLDKERQNSSSKSVSINKPIQKQLSHESLAEVSIREDSVGATVNENIGRDSISRTIFTIDRDNFVAKENLLQLPRPKTSGWTLALVSSGNAGQNDISRYRIPNPGLPDTEAPDGEIEVTEKAHHQMPIVIGLSINKTVSSRWSFETGVRYTYLRSEFLSESKLKHTETIQRIHYLGVPFKFNYRIFTYGGLSIYGQGGGALDIPVNGSQSVSECLPEWGNQNKRSVNAPLQWSVEGGLGGQYRLTSSFSIYVEPSLRYYFNSGSEIETIRQKRPLELTMPIGLRLTW
ncbi:MAG: sigma-70 family RNA polymerase sigma factor [Paramuribaculum sp.]|nr:sigma-70 family RNA polymerase sigma factor [Paramuribaculum sp.]